MKGYISILIIAAFIFTSDIAEALRPLASEEKIQPNPTPGDWSEEAMKLMKAYGLRPNTESLLPQDCGELEVMGKKVARTDLLMEPHGCKPVGLHLPSWGNCQL